MSFKITIECEEYYGNGQYTSTLYVKGEDFFDVLGRFVKKSNSCVHNGTIISSIKIEYSDITFIN